MANTIFALASALIMNALRILIANHQDVVREGLRAVLAPQQHWQICGEAATGREAVDKAIQLKPDVVVLDFNLPELNGLDATRQIRTALPNTEVLILMGHECEGLAQEALAAGARALVAKTDTKHQLIPAVKALARHEPFFCSRVSAFVLNGFLHPGSRAVRGETTRGRLTPREREVIQLIAEGKTSKEIAVLLKASVRTVDAHRANIMHKLNVHSVSQLVLYAVRNQIVEA